MPRPHALLRAGFPYLNTIGMRRITSGPVDLAIGREGRLYILCRGTIQTEIRKYDFEDTDYGPISGPGPAEGKFLWPAAIIADGQEDLYVSDEECDRISTFSRDGDFMGSWGEHGDADGQINRPSGIAFDSEENVYVSDTLNHRIQKFTKGGKFLMKFGGYGAGDGELDMPWGISLDEVDDVYVVDWRNDRIQKFTADGRFLMKFGESGSGDGQFNRPSGVAVDRDGDIYVADRGNDRVQLFSPEGTYVDKFIGDATLSPSGRKYIMSNAVTLRLRETTGSLEPSKRLRGPMSVRVDEQGHMYIPDYGSHRVQVYKKEAYALDETQIAPVPRSPTLYTA